jgi:hypothetical protein
MTEPIEVRSWSYGPKADRAQADYRKVERALSGDTATCIWRTMTRDRKTWHLHAAGLPADLDGIVRHIRGKRCAEPEPGLWDALRARHARLLHKAVVTKQPHGDHHYGPEGAWLYKGGGMRRRKEGDD